MYTLGRNYILRQNSKNSFELFNTVKSMKYNISLEFFYLLKLFKYNTISVDDAYNYFLDNGIPINIEKFNKCIINEPFIDLLEKSNTPHTVNYEFPRLNNFPPFVDNTPSRVDLILTERCNLTCKHCFQNSSPLRNSDFPSLDKLIILCDELEQLNVLSLKISGGEPLIYPHIEQFLEYLTTKKMQKSVLSNAVLLNDRIIDIIKGHHFRFGISLDGSTKELHEFLRGKNTFDRTMKNIKKLKETNIYFSISTTLHSKNYYDISNICDLVFNKLGAVVLNVNIMMPLGRGNNGLVIPQKELKILKKHIAELSELYQDKSIDVADANDLLPYKSSSEIIYCNGGTNYIALDSLLNVYPCTYAFGHESFKMGTIGEEKLIDIWRKDKWNIFRGDTKLQDLKTCPTCIFKERCANKNCRLKPIYEGLDFYSPISFCTLNS